MGSNQVDGSATSASWATPGWLPADNASRAMVRGSRNEARWIGRPIPNRKGAGSSPAVATMSNTEKLFIAEATLRRAAETYADWANANTAANPADTRRARLNAARAALRSAALEFANVARNVIRKVKP